MRLQGNEADWVGVARVPFRFPCCTESNTSMRKRRNFWN